MFNNLLWCQNHHHLAPFELGFGFDLGNLFGIFSYFFEKIHSKVHVSHFTTAKPQRNLHLVAIIEKTPHRAHFHIVVMGVDVRTHLNFFDLDGLLFFARFRCFLLGGIFVFAEIEDLADRWTVGRGNLNEIKACFPGQLQGFLKVYRTSIIALCVNKLNFRGGNFSICART